MRAARAHAIDSGRRAARVGPFLLYLARSVLALLILLFAAARRFPHSGGTQGHLTKVALTAELDVFLALLPLLIALGFVLLLIPRIERGPRRTLWQASVALCAGLAAAALPGLVIYLRRGLLMPNAGAWAAAALLGLNTGLLCWAQLNGGPARRSRRLALWAFPLSDLLLPTLVWAAQRSLAGRSLNLLKPLPAGLVCGLALLALAAFPLPAESRIHVDPALSLLNPGCYSQVLLDPGNGELIAVDRFRHEIERIDPRSGRVLARTDLPPIRLNAAALDQRSGRLRLASPYFGAIIELDAGSLQIVRIIPLARAPGQMGLTSLVPGDLGVADCRTVEDRDRGLLLAACENEAASLCPRDGSVRAVYTQWGELGDALLDPDEDALHLCARFPGTLFKLDARTLEPLAWSGLPLMPERLALDSPAHRLFVSLSMTGALLLLDSRDYRLLDYAPTFPGAFALVLDRSAGELLLAGYSPFAELRSSADLRLRHRLIAPPYVQSIVVDPERGAAYLASRMHGLYRLDLAELRSRPADSGDPFVDLLILLSAWARDAFGWPGHIERVRPHEPRILSSDCADRESP